jgi:hypothetical protein
MEVDGARSPGASSRERHLGFSVPGDKRAENIDGRPHLLYMLVWGLVFPDGRRIHLQDVVLELNPDSHRAQKCRHCGNITKSGGITKAKFARGKKSGGHECQ